MKGKHIIAKVRKQSVLAVFMSCFICVASTGAMALQAEAELLISTDTTAINNFNWSVAGELPPASGQDNQPGLAGAFSGVSAGALIVAGGANFPGQPAWEGGKKMWWDDIYVLTKVYDSYRWHQHQFNLEHRVAYGASVTIPEGVLCVGGHNEAGLVSDIVLLTWDPLTKQITQKKLGKLPEGLSVTGVFASAGIVYVSGINSEQNQLISAPMDQLLSQAVSWTSLPGCPGLPRQMPAYATQSNGQDIGLYLLGGRSASDNGIEVHNDGYAFNTRTLAWRKIDDVPPVMAAPAIAYGTNNILIFGGDDGKLLLERNGLEQYISQSHDSIKRDSAKSRLRQSFLSHPGFGRDIVAYNTITNTFQRAGELSQNPPVTSNAVVWEGSIYLTSGEIKPGVRTPDVVVSKLDRKAHQFGTLNYTVLVIYFIGLLIIGIYFASRQKSTQDYFKGGGRIPWWAAGLSIFGTALSAITFMAIPAKTFATDWSYFFYNLSILLSTPIIVFLFIPFYRRLNITTAYEYLEQRFNVAVRLFGSLAFIIFQLGRIAIVLYLPAIALSLVTGVDIYLCILVVGAFSIAYTLIGGIEAVIWTDVVQVIILMGGAVLTLIIIYLDINEDFSSLITQATDSGKLTIANMNFAFNAPTIWVVVIGGFFANLITYSSDQTLVQRYLTTSDEKGAKKTAWTNALLVIPSTLIFFAVGTGLYLFYSHLPEKLDPFAQNNDAIFPWFIVNELPQGVSGLLIAGLFSAAMSSLSSSINSTSTAFTTDFYKRFKKVQNDSRDMRVARWATLISGVCGVLFALWMATFDIVSLWDQFFKVLGLFTSGLGGVFLLGMLFKKASSTGAIAGLVASSIVQYLVASFTDLHVFLYAATGLITCIVVGLITSLIIKDSADSAGKKLTIHNKLFRN